MLWLQMRKRSQKSQVTVIAHHAPPGSSKYLPSCWGDHQPACPHQAPSPLGPNCSFLPAGKNHHHVNHVCSPPFLTPWTL